MPAEAIHLSAFQDSLVRSQAASVASSRELFALGRLGAVAIDLPYFDNFPVSVARYLLRMTTATSAWGNFFHERMPVRVAKLLLESVRALRERPSTRQSAERVLAFALGYMSHLALDRSMHPMVNRLARARAERLSDSWLRQHTEVEKFQSVLFHEQRNGFDFMGRRELSDHIAVEGSLLHRDDALGTAYFAAVTGALGTAPARPLVARWARGYAQYTRLVSSPLGKTMVPEKVKREVRAEVFDGALSFARDYAEAVEFSTRAIDVGLAYAEQSASEAAFDQTVPEGTIDGGAVAS